MKKFLFATLLLCTLVILAACDTNGDATAPPAPTTATQDDATSTEPPTTEAPGADLPTGAAVLQIAPAADVNMDEFTHLYHTDSSDTPGIDLIIWADQPLLHFSMIGLEPDWLDNMEAWGFRPLYDFGHIDIVEPGAAFVVVNYMGAGTLPHRGIAFYDMYKDETRFFFFQENHAYPEGGGPWIFHEIEAERIIWGYTGTNNSDYRASHEIVEGQLIINGVDYGRSVYTLPGHAQPTHVSMLALWLADPRLDVISAGSQAMLQLDGANIGVNLRVMNYLATGADRVALDINDTFMADDEFFSIYIPITLITRLGFQVQHIDGTVHINGQVNVTNTPHPFAVALQNFIDNAQGEVQAHLPAINSTSSALLVIETVDGFSEATVYALVGDQLISKDMGNIDGFPFSLGFTSDGWGNLIQLTGDGSNSSYTMMGIATNPTTGADEIVYLFTIYNEANDDGTRRYYRFDGGWHEGIEGARHAITEAEFTTIREGMGDWIVGWRDSWDSTESILSWVSPIWYEPVW